MSRIVITPPANDPVTPADMMVQLGMVSSAEPGADSILANQLAPHIAQATQDVEGYCRRALVLQTWQVQLARFPRCSEVYAGSDYGQSFALPLPPLLAIDSVQYLDLSGTLQSLPYAATGSTVPGYAYRLIAGGEQPARLARNYFYGWPICMCAEDSVRIQFRAGYGGNIQLSVDGPTATGYAFTPGDVGNPIIIPGALGGQAGPLVTTVASVDGQGKATLSAAATTPVEDATAYYGRPVPASLTGAIKFLAQFYYEQDVVSPTDWPPFVLRRLNRVRNLLS